MERLRAGRRKYAYVIVAYICITYFHGVFFFGWGEEGFREGSTYIYAYMGYILVS